MNRAPQALVVLCSLSIPILGTDSNQLETTAVPLESQHNLVDNLNAFGYRLMTQALEKNDTANVIMSPLGVSVLMAMALLGSTGVTYEEIADVLGFSRGDILSNRKRHEDFGGLLRLLEEPPTKTSLAAAAFVDRNTRLRSLYREFLGRVYGGDALYADFADSSSSKLAINEWVKMHTEGKIDNFLGENPPTSTKVVLLNALYFKGQWAKPFTPSYTTKMTFRGPAKNITTDYMLNSGDFHYILSAKDGLHMIALPYNDSTTTMYVLKPIRPQRLTLTTLLQTLDYAKIDELINRMNKEPCVIRFPKMNIKSHLNLAEYIKLKAPSMFDAGIANFALMVDGVPEVGNFSEADLLTRYRDGDEDSKKLKDLLNSLANPGIHVDSILQEVNINIDEYGTEATAATAGTLARTAELFYATSPFYMFIRNEKTKLVTFSAVIFDPSDGI